MNLCLAAHKKERIVCETMTLAWRQKAIHNHSAQLEQMMLMRQESTNPSFRHPQKKEKSIMFHDNFIFCSRLFMIVHFSCFILHFCVHGCLQSVYLHASVVSRFSAIFQQKKIFGDLSTKNWCHLGVSLGGLFVLCLCLFKFCSLKFVLCIGA